jgi:hypothetical protein
MSNQGEFIYSSHLWGGLLGLNKQSSNTSANSNLPKLEKQRKVSEHTWDHEEPILRDRKFSYEDESLSNKFNPFDSLI